MITKEQGKEEVRKLVEKYNRLAESGKVKSYNEEMTKKDFILPLFRALGWSVEDGDEVTAEEKISKGRVDYAFRIEGIPKLFLEAKALREDLSKKEFAEQSINYAWHKGAVWAVLTDFEGIKVFNAEWKSINYLQNQFFSINCNQFLDNFEQLWLLSRESLELGLIDKEAEKWGKKAKKIPVDKQLLSDLTRFRELLTKNILKNNASKNLTEEDLEESVQRIIDRLIFIRTLEDKQLEAPILQSLIRENTNKKICKKLNDVFRSIDDTYNSKLFSPHLCEEVVIDDEIIEKIIYGLFKTSDNTVHYDFSALDADVLGNIYEQYLGHILKKTAKRASLTEGRAHRKEQGIYYTPTYVVDYIVKNTIGELAKDKKFDLKNIKVLDPACGSGSFLMKAFDYLVTLDKKKNGEIAQTKLDLTGASASYGRKVEILKENIFGVDLDTKAVEIAQLNLLLKTAEKKHRLPTLQENIKVGNSLIDDSTIAGDRAFKWENEFKDIIKNGGFDVVIGNPPYIFARNQKFNDEEKTYYYKKYKLQKYQLNTYGLFVERAYELLKHGGFLGFIIPNNWLTIETFSTFREFILKNCSDLHIINFFNKVFEEANVDTCIIILKKGTPNKISLAEMRERKLEEIGKFRWNEFEKNNNIINIPLLKNRKSLGIITKIENNSTSLKDISNVSTGLKAYQVGKGVPKQTEDVKKNRKFHSKQRLSKEYYPYLEGKDVGRYILSWSGEFLKYGDFLAEPRKSVPFNGERILVRQIPSKLPYCINAVLTNREVLHDINSMVIFNFRAYHSKLILGVINSKLISYWFFNKFGKLQRKLFPQFKVKELKLFPIFKKRDKDLEAKIILLIDKILSLNKRLNEIKNKQTDEKARLEKEIQKLDDEIDQEVYNIYGITKEEQKIIEESLK
ncbi:N-6 DNA methylase [Candidatus Woesearchaeota archaeon]|nr:N-6 DNA methylase [Candidatus Woesearchaeota archaeon]